MGDALSVRPDTKAKLELICPFNHREVILHNRPDVRCGIYLGFEVVVAFYDRQIGDCNRKAEAAEYIQRRWLHRSRGLCIQLERDASSSDQRRPEQRRSIYIPRHFSGVEYHSGRLLRVL